jgi:U3 small nucleolar RNA-associated protein 14
VASARRAGALILGKTVTTEFAYFQAGKTTSFMPRNVVQDCLDQVGEDAKVTEACSCGTRQIMELPSAHHCPCLRDLGIQSSL